MQAGALRDRVGFYRRVETDDGYGNTEADFAPAPHFTCAARIAPRLGGEQVLAGRLAGTNLVNITVRASADVALVDETWRIRDERAAVLYNIRSIIDPGQGTPRQGAFVELLCEKGGAS